jgi:hypothetical protein
MAKLHDVFESQLSGDKHAMFCCVIGETKPSIHILTAWKVESGGNDILMWSKILERQEHKHIMQ